MKIQHENKLKEKTKGAVCKNCKSENTFIAKQISLNPNMWIQQCTDCNTSYGFADL